MYVHRRSYTEPDGPSGPTGPTQNPDGPNGSAGSGGSGGSALSYQVDGDDWNRTGSTPEWKGKLAMPSEHQAYRIYTHTQTHTHKHTHTETQTQTQAQQHQHPLGFKCWPSVNSPGVS